jgi:hypothetical protein
VLLPQLEHSERVPARTIHSRKLAVLGTLERAPAELFRKAALQGIGAVRYTGDLAWNVTCDAQTPLYGMTGAVGAPSTFVSVNRANGAQTIIGAVGAAGIDIFGLAYDGFGTLWGTSSTGVIGTVNTATGVWTPAAGLALGGAVVIPFDLASTPRCLSCDSAMLGDLGDAPDSTNHYATSAMTAYPAVSANFPTVFDEATGVPVGPMHWFPKQDHWLGVDVSSEADADLLPDNDGLTNIDPTMDLANRDFYDDGLLSPISLPNCQLTSIQYSVRIVGAATSRYVNAWIDFNRDGGLGGFDDMYRPGNWTYRDSGRVGGPRSCILERARNMDSHIAHVQESRH